MSINPMDNIETAEAGNYTVYFIKFTLNGAKESVYFQGMVASRTVSDKELADFFFTKQECQDALDAFGIAPDPKDVTIEFEEGTTYLSEKFLNTMRDLERRNQFSSWHRHDEEGK